MSLRDDEEQPATKGTKEQASDKAALITEVESIDNTSDYTNLFCFTSFVDSKHEAVKELEQDTLKVLLKLKESYDELLLKLKQTTKA